ncbi:hypothetical protein B5M42_020225 [Paenibacillus athensensis]|uniref:Uncharacterized protein n=1 Tax=Paenibacillus athensensis TaxID=1967502 RepID=A0A4Y8Q0F2_9BACL|nr:hypothetical protein [Paenibacillus athensensis]MCD1261136.1 hypothetical protein [Paenibacillus athensensis]
MWIRRVRKSVRASDTLTDNVESTIPSDIAQVVHQYFQNYSSFKASRGLQTDTYIREVFYATKKDPADLRTIEEMEAYVDETNRHRLQLKSYEIDEFFMLGSAVAVLGVTREFGNGHRNRVLYVLHKDRETWKFHHIARSHRGHVLDKFRVSEQLGFVIGDEKAAMLFLTTQDVPNAAMLMQGDHVNVEGYLDVEQQGSGELYYRIFRINRIH